MTQPRSSPGRFSPLLVIGLLLGLVVAGGVFFVLDPILAAFVAIVVVVGLGMTVAARDWDRHETFEERELARARRRQEKWDRNADARAKDRARWEAHQARRAAQDGSS